MKILNKTLAAISAAFFMCVHSVYTYGDIKEERCTAFSDIVYQIALKRDQGWSRFDVRALIHEKFDKSISEASLLLVDMAYKKPWGTPSEEAQNFYKQCMDYKTGKPT